MKSLKVVALALLVLCVTGGLFANGASEGGADKVRVLNIASTFPVGSPMHDGALLFEEKLEAATDGRYDVLIHAAGAMGGEQACFEGLMSGAIEASMVGGADISTFYPQFAFFETPYSMASNDDFWAAWHGPGAEVNDIILKEKKVRVVATVLRGARYMTTNKPIYSADDVKGLKIRLPEVPSWVKYWSELEALPTVVAFSELYLALKQGMVEAQENPPETIYSYKFYEAQKYLIATKHVYSTARIEMSQKWLDSIPAEDQELILDLWKEAGDYMNKIAAEKDALFVQKLQDEGGMTLIEPDITKFQSVAGTVLDEIAQEEWDMDMYNKLKAAVQ